MSASCPTGKYQFTTIRSARTALHRAQRSERQRRHERSFYRCERCRAYHLTSYQPKKGQRFT